jgi:signal transduction histidine kinase
MNLRLLYILIPLLLSGRGFSQKDESLKSLYKQYKNENYAGVLKNLPSIRPDELSTSDKGLYYYISGKIEDINNKDAQAFENFLLSKKYYNEAGEASKAQEINIDLTYLVYFSDNKKRNKLQYINEYLDYANKNEDSLMLANGYMHLASLKVNDDEFEQSLPFFKKAINYNSKIKDKSIEILINQNIASLYNEYLDNPELALHYLKKNQDYLLKNNKLNGLCDNYINQAAAYYYLNELNKAISYLKKADSLPIKKYKLKSKENINRLLSVNYQEIGDFNNAYKHLILSQEYSDSLKESDHEIAIEDIEAKYQNKLLKSKVKTNRILKFTFLGLLFASIVIGWLIVKNARRREKIADQGKLIEQQKLEKALKDYELQSIDLMLEGQEKERERIANDLHDNLGSMLATLKLNFENLKLRKNELAGDENKLYERTDELIEEAYQKVRRLAHAKNAGVIANEGLLPAIKKLAEKLTLPGKITVQVVDFGFDSRLDNTLEIAVFRMVQELSTNIIKHSHATEATIHLTHHDDNINIIIEDNGVGFIPESSGNEKGMGLQAIKRKAAQLGGSLTIDSTPGKGTTVIIDIPV